MSIIDQAKDELKAINFGDEDTKVMIEILEKFFDHWDSGGAVVVAGGVLLRLLAGVPLTPLTGEDDEWVVHDYSPDLMAQNKRCGTVFKRRDGTAYDCATGRRVEIVFPYTPDAVMHDPVIVMKGSDAEPA